MSLSISLFFLFLYLSCLLFRLQIVAVFLFYIGTAQTSSSPLLNFFLFSLLCLLNFSNASNPDHQSITIAHVFSLSFYYHKNNRHPSCPHLSSFARPIVSTNEYLFKRPLVLLANFFLFLWREVVLDVESLANFRRRLPFDHVRDGLAAQIEQILDVQVVRRQDELKQRRLIDLHVIQIEVLFIVLRFVFAVLALRVGVVFAIRDHSLQNRLGHVR